MEDHDKTLLFGAKIHHEDVFDVSPISMAWHSEFEELDIVTQVEKSCEDCRGLFQALKLYLDSIKYLTMTIFGMLNADFPAQC